MFNTKCIHWDPSSIVQKRLLHNPSPALDAAQTATEIMAKHTNNALLEARREAESGRKMVDLDNVSDHDTWIESISKAWNDMALK